MTKTIAVFLGIAMSAVPGCLTISERQSDDLVAIHHRGDYAWYGIHTVTMSSVLPVPFVQTATKLCPIETTERNAERLHIPVIKLSPHEGRTIITHPWEKISEHIAKSCSSNHIFWIISAEPVILAVNTNGSAAKKIDAVYDSSHYARFLLCESRLHAHFVLKEDWGIETHLLHRIDLHSDPIIIDYESTIGELLELRNLESLFN